MSSTDVPILGPCNAWITSEEALACCAAAGTDAALLDSAAIAASQILYELSGRQFNGICIEDDYRPCADGCSCWDRWLPAVSMSGQSSWGWSGFGWGYWGWGWGWGYSGCVDDLCHCGALSRALLNGYPVTEILEVKIDGVVLDPEEYRLDGNRFLTRMADGSNNAQFWPACQRLDLDSDQPGTWSVSYEYGIAPPMDAILAAEQLTCQLYLACAGGGAGGTECRLPAGVTKIVRQNVTIEFAPFLAWALRNGSWATGLSLVDAFLSTRNPRNLRGRPSVWSPDAPKYGYAPGA
jgi:hypothetical protein